MTLGRSATVLALGLMTGILAFVGLAVLRTPSLADPGDTASLEFGVGLVGLGLLSAVTAWGVSGGRPWGRLLALIAATGCAAAGIFGLYGLVVMVAQVASFSRSNLAVLAVLLVSGVTAVVLFVASLRERPTDTMLRPPAWRLASVVLAVAAGIVASALFASFLSTLVEPPCCPA